MTQWEKALATKSDNLSLIPGIHVVARTHSPGLASSLHMYARMHAHTVMNISKDKRFMLTDLFRTDQGIAIVESGWPVRDFSVV